MSLDEINVAEVNAGTHTHTMTVVTAAAEAAT